MEPSTRNRKDGYRRGGQEKEHGVSFYAGGGVVCFAARRAKRPPKRVKVYPQTDLGLTPNPRYSFFPG